MNNDNNNKKQYIAYEGGKVRSLNDDDNKFMPPDGQQDSSFSDEEGTYEEPSDFTGKVDHSDDTQDDGSESVNINKPDVKNDDNEEKPQVPLISTLSKIAIAGLIILVFILIMCFIYYKPNSTNTQKRTTSTVTSSVSGSFGTGTTSTPNFSSASASANEIYNLNGLLQNINSLDSSLINSGSNEIQYIRNYEIGTMSAANLYGQVQQILSSNQNAINTELNGTDAVSKKYSADKFVGATKERAANCIDFSNAILNTLKNGGNSDNLDKAIENFVEKENQYAQSQQSELIYVLIKNNIQFSTNTSDNTITYTYNSGNYAEK